MVAETGSDVRIVRSRADRCTLCGQVFWYCDESIEGIELWEPVDEYEGDPGDSVQLPKNELPRTWHERLLEEDEQR